MSSQSFSDLSQADWIRAYRKLGLIVDTSGGKGSHAKITNQNTNKKYTIQHKLHKFINIKIFKKMLEWGFSEEQIWNALR